MSVSTTILELHRSPKNVFENPSFHLTDRLVHIREQRKRAVGLPKDRQLQ